MGTHNVCITTKALHGYHYDTQLGTFAITTDDGNRYRAVFEDKDGVELPVYAIIDDDDGNALNSDIDYCQNFERRIRFGNDDWTITIKVRDHIGEPVKVGFRLAESKETLTSEISP